MSQIKLKHSGGNGVIIAAPTSNPASDRTLLLPSNADSTIDTLNRAGNILQVKTAHKTDVFSHATATFTDITGLSVDITPVAASSKIYIISSVCIGGAGNSFPAFRLRRDGSDVTKGTDATGNQTAVTFGCRLVNSTEVDQLGYNFLDSPSYSLGATLTYNLQLASRLNNYTVRVNRSEGAANANYTFSGTSTISVMEVAG